MATRKKPRRPEKKATSNSKITQAQKAASEKRIEQDTLRAQSSAERARQAAGKPTSGLLGPTKLEPVTQTGASGPTKLEPINGPLANRGKGIDQGEIAARDAGKSMSDAANKIAGLATPIQASMQQPSAIANPSLYGVSTAKRAANINSLVAAVDDANAQGLKDKGNAVYMGQRQVQIRNSGPERIDPETGKSTSTERLGMDIVNKNSLLAWLSDPAKVDQIKKAAEASGLTMSTYDDIAKLWGSVVSQAASSYSLGGKQVTPWALIQLRGKYAVNGRPADKITTSTNIDEMDPATARLMFEQTAQQALGRAPTKAEIDDFIAKAQTIAHQNPGVTTTRHQMGYDGLEESQTSHTVGGQSVVKDKAQVAAMDQAKQAEDYSAYQAAGNYFPMLFQALQSPV